MRAPWSGRHGLHQHLHLSALPLAVPGKQEDFTITGILYIFKRRSRRTLVPMSVTCRHIRISKTIEITSPSPRTQQDTSVRQFLAFRLIALRTSRLFRTAEDAPCLTEIITEHHEDTLMRQEGGVEAVEASHLDFTTLADTS